MPQAPPAPRLPIGPLLALSSAAFLAIMTEALPAGILPAVSRSLSVSEAAAGQIVTIYAVGSVLGAVPLTAASVGWNRRRVLLTALAGFVLTNTVVAFSTGYSLTMSARFVNGVAAGMLWSLMAGYAQRLVRPEQRGRATAIALAGTPVALSVGVPVGTFAAGLVGWRWTLGAISALTLLLIAWVVAGVPDRPGQARQGRASLAGAIARPGVVPVLATALAFVLAHNVLYTYMAPFLAGTRPGSRVDTVLLAFGVSSLISIWLTGVLIDRHLRPLVLGSIVLFTVAATTLAVFSGLAWVVYVAVAAWGFAFGGAAPLLQTAAAEAGGDDVVDVIQSMIVTTWNLGIGAGAILGGILLSRAGPTALAWVPAGLLTVSLGIALSARTHAFPTLQRRATRQPAP
ncbi:MFS transporter [Microlunatus spumicola]|uniref:MFS transporter n=1 Tax=Microlunatus spumicola TaxID=81499 RepID=A0ABP6WLD1_9ACTN